VRRQRLHTYKCACRQIELKTTVHNKIQRGQNYTCNFCKSVLVKA
jgi:SprT protein